MNFCNLVQAGPQTPLGFPKKVTDKLSAEECSHLSDNDGNKDYSRRAVIILKVLNLEEF